MAEPNISSQDSISLSSLKNVLIGFLRLFFQLSRLIVIAAVRGIYFMLIGLALGVLVAFIYMSTKKTVYETAMIVEFHKLTKKTYGEILTQLNSVALRGTPATLAGELAIDEKTAASIISIEGRNLTGEDLATDTTTKTHQSFKIVVRLRNETDVKPLETAFLNYLNNRPYLKLLIEEQKKILEQSLLLVQTDIRKLDTLKTEFNRFLANSKVSASVYNNAMNPADLYDQSTKLMFHRDNILKVLNIEKDPVALLDGFKIVASPQNTAPFNIYTIFGITGFLLGFLASLFIETQRKVMLLSK